MRPQEICPPEFALLIRPLEILTLHFVVYFDFGQQGVHVALGHNSTRLNTAAFYKFRFSSFHVTGMKAEQEGGPTELIYHRYNRTLT